MSRKTIKILKNVIAKRVTSPGFDRFYENIRVVSGGDGSLCCELDVTPDMLNVNKTLHGGATATLVDMASTYAFSTVGDGNVGVSVDLNVSYIKPVFENETVLIKANTLKRGKTLAVGTVDIYNKATGELVAHGRQTKIMPPAKQKGGKES